MRGRCERCLLGVLALLVIAVMLSACASESSRPRAQTSESVNEAAQRIFPEAVAMAGEGLALSPSATASTPLATALDYNFPSAIPAGWVVTGGSWAISEGMFDHMSEAERDPDKYLVPIVDGGVVISDFELWRSEGGWEIGPVTVGNPTLGEKPSSYTARIEAARAALGHKLGGTVDLRVAVFVPSGVVAAVGRVGENEAAVVVGSAQGEGITGIDDFPDYERVYSGQEFATALR